MFAASTDGDQEERARRRTFDQQRADDAVGQAALALRMRTASGVRALRHPRCFQGSSCRGPYLAGTSSRPEDTFGKAYKPRLRTQRMTQMTRSGN